MTTGDPCQQCNFLCLGDGQACTMTKGGVYLPLPEHIEMFCKTPYFTDCHQYIRGNKLSSTSDLNESLRHNGRRQFRRVPDMLSLILSDCDISGAPCQLIDDQAFTIDLSPGGLRLESRKKLTPNHLIAFTFGPDFSLSNIGGVGQIRWSCESDQPDVFHAGLEFRDHATKQVIGHHMGITV